MDQPIIDARRLESLERELKRLKRVFPILAVGFGVLLLWQLLPGPETVEARHFVVRDERGKPRIMLTMWEGDKPTVRLNDAMGKARAMWFLYPERGGALRFTDTTGYHRLQLTMTPEGSPEVWLGSEQGRTRSWLGVVSGDSPGLVLTDQDLQWLWAAPPRNGR